MTNSTAIDAERIAHALDKGRRSGSGWVACCPAHDDANPSLSVTDNPDGGAPLVHCHAGCPQDAVLGELKARGLWTNGSDAELRCYEYLQADGTPHLTVCMYRDRLTGKKTDRRPWREPRGVKDPHPLYRLRELLASDPARTVLVVEGEHTCDAARSAWPGEAVVTWAGGCKSWRQTDWTPLCGRTVTICADTDDQGRTAARAIAACLHGIGATVSLALPDGETGDDLADWLREGREVAQALLRRLKVPFTPETAQGAGLPTLTIAELLDRPEDATAWLVEGILPTGGFSAFTGKPKSGKSTAARHLAHAIACGESWLNRDTASGPALYLALEEKVSEVRRHFMALGTPRDAPLHVCFHRTPGDAAALLGETIERIGPVLVIVDTLFRFQPVDDTSAYGNVLKALSPLHELARKTDAHILAVHHERKAEGEGGDRVLGSTAIFGTVDVMLSIERRHADNVRVISSVGRYGEDLPETVIELRPDGSVTLAGAADEIREGRARDAVLAFVAENPGATQDDIKDRIGLRWQLAHAALMALVGRNAVTRSGAGKAGDPYRHHVAMSCSRTNGDERVLLPVPPPKGAEQEISGVPGTGAEQAEQEAPTSTPLTVQPAGTVTAGDAYRKAHDGE